jgi:alpha-N-arabinofuranosidase
VGPDFYLITSSFEFFPGVPIYRSRDLVHWTQIGHVLTRASQLDLAGVYSSGGIYAPTLRHHAGRFYMITTLVGSPRRHGNANFYVTADDPRGPWSDPIWLDDDGFDPSLLFDDGEVYYLRDGKGATFEHPRVYQTRIDPVTGARRDPMQVIWEGMGGVWPEGAHVYKMKGHYYLFAAEGGTEYGHAEMVGRSDAPFGPFQPSPHNPALTHRDRRDHPIQATGHADLVELEDGTTWAVFLGVRPQAREFQHLGRETFLAPVHFSADGWPTIGDGGHVEVTLPAPALAPQPPPPAPARDDFDRPALALAWNFVRNPNPADASLAARPGFLRLTGSAVTLDDVASPALVVRRQQHFRVRCRAALDFAPRAPNEEAGLTVRAREDSHYDLAVRVGAAGREAVLSSRIAGTSTIVGRAPLPDGAVTLEVSTDETSYTFAVAAGANARQVLGTLPTRALSAEEIHRHGKNHFTGVMIGLYATGHGRPSTTPADFDWFDYEPSDR